MMDIFQILVTSFACAFLVLAFEKVIMPVLNKRKVTVVYKVDYSLKYAYESNDQFVERAFRERLGSYKIVGYHV